MDINPVQKGHTLVVPKKEVDYIFDIDDNDIQEMMLFAKQVAVRIKEAIPCTKVGVAVIGLEVPHAHIHLVPMQKEGDLDFKRPKLQLTEEEFLDIQKKIAF